MRDACNRRLRWVHIVAMELRKSSGREARGVSTGMRVSVGRAPKQSSAPAACCHFLPPQHHHHQQNHLLSISLPAGAVVACRSACGFLLTTAWLCELPRTGFDCALRRLIARTKAQPFIRSSTSSPTGPQLRIRPK